ncbi:uncharacterized protein LOC124367442 isoform X1 [Homalodisca vitripennis]|nr:uncharacterized protein LOC124367442 isoform X1 [Homalodisca vitripennis]
METLPAEVVEMIALFLSIKDLKACCGTTHTWRDIFGQDTIWKRHCNRALAKCLGAAQSRVEPKFVLSEEEHLKNLSPLGEWRQAYLQEQLLWSHWRNGNYVMEELTIKSSYKCKRMKVKENMLCHFVTDHYLITLCKRKVMLWDVCNSPVIVSKPFELLLTGDVNFCSTFGNDKIIIVQQTLVQIYHHGSPMELTWSLEQSFFFDREDPVPFNKTDKTVTSPLNSRCVVDENLFVGILLSGEVHIWNLTSGKKLKTVLYPGSDNVNNCIVKVVHSEKPPKDFIIVAKWFFTYNFYVFSMTSLDFYYVQNSETLELTLPSCAIQHGLLAVGTTKSSKVFNYRTSQRLLKVLPTIGKFTIGLVAMGDYFLLVEEEKIHLFHTITTTYECVIHIPVVVSYSHRISACFNTICDKFLIIKYSLPDFDSLDNPALEIYLKTNPIKIIRRRNFNFCHIFAMNSVSSKLAVQSSNGNVCIVSFW